MIQETFFVEVKPPPEIRVTLLGCNIIIIMDAKGRELHVCVCVFVCLLVLFVGLEGPFPTPMPTPTPWNILSIGVTTQRSGIKP